MASPDTEGLVPGGVSEDLDTNFDYLFKIVLIGDAGVGKTAIVHRFKYNTFVERHASTIGVDFTLKVMVTPLLLCLSEDNLRMSCSPVCLSNVSL